MCSTLRVVQICEDLMTRCLAPDCRLGGLGCDNMTVIIICLLHGGNLGDLAERCKRPADVTSGDARIGVPAAVPVASVTLPAATVTTLSTTPTTSSAAVIIEPPRDS